MCNEYSQKRGQQEVMARTRAVHDRTGNLPELPGIFPDTMAPVVRTDSDGARELLMMRWGFPPPPAGRVPVTNVRNTSSPFWRAWLKPEFRCLVPATSFCEFEDTKPKKTPTWFALSEERPLFFFAGIWRPWTGARGPKKAPVEGAHLLYSFLTCDANALVKLIHPKAMPVILTSEAECDAWMSAPVDEALKHQRPLADDALMIVARGPRVDA